MGGQARGLSPAGGRFLSRDISPAPIRRAPLPGGLARCGWLAWDLHALAHPFQSFALFQRVH